MPFDYKKEYKEFYMPASKPSIVTVPKTNYIAVRGISNTSCRRSKVSGGRKGAAK